MFKKAIPLLFVLLPFFTCAQKDSSSFRKPYISAGVGFCFPINQFPMQIPGVTGDGEYAKNGYMVNIAGAYPIHHSCWAVIGNIGYSAEAFDVNKMFITLCDAPNNTNQLTSGAYSDFKETLLLAGISFSAGKKSIFTFKFMVGGNICTTASYSLTGTSTYTVAYTPPNLGGGVGAYTSTDNITSSLQPGNASVLACDAGITCRLLQKTHLMVLLNTDFIASQANVNTTFYYRDIDGNYTWTATSNHSDITYRLFSISASIGYKF